MEGIFFIIKNGYFMYNFFSVFSDLRNIMESVSNNLTLNNSSQFAFLCEQLQEENNILQIKLRGLF